MKKIYPKEIIMGKNISIKALDLNLAQKMFDYVDEDRERLSKYLSWPPKIKSVMDEIMFIKGQQLKWTDYELFSFAIFRNTDDEYLGNINAFSINWNSHHFEIGYWILGNFEGKGYMSEAVKLLINEFRDMGFNRITVRCDVQNKRSSKIPIKIGFKKEGIQRQVKRLNNKYRDLEVYSLTKDDPIN